MSDDLGPDEEEVLRHEEGLALGQAVQPVIAALAEVGMAPDRTSAYGHIYFHRTLTLEELAVVAKAYQVCGVQIGQIETGFIPARQHRKFAGD
jgi:hypothetical protein